MPPIELTTASNAERRGIHNEITNADPLVLTPSSTVSWTFSSGRVAKITLNQNINLATNEPPVGVSLLLVKQDGTGGFDVTFNSSWKVTGSIGQAANQYSVCQIFHFKEENFMSSDVPFVIITPFT